MNWYLEVLKKYAVFNGRARRKEYWYFTLFHMIVAFILGFIGGLLHFPMLGNIYVIAVLLPAIGVSIRRMHDVGKSGWFILIPLYNLILACTAGDIGTNEYGPDPKNGAEFGAGDYQKPFTINPEA
jgi:uncharacterized membrane protein YhaH (DUF805 family)